MNDGAHRFFLLALLLLATGCTAGGKTFDVRSFGATGDGAAKDTAAFQKALDAATNANGGTVIVPAGGYLIGSIVLGSNTTLRLDKGATLVGSPDKDDYPIMTIRWEGVWRDGHRALIHSANAKHIAIVGPGKIVGNFPLGHLRNPRGPCIIETIECDDVRLEDFSVQYERMWAIHPTCCTNVSAKNLTIRSSLDNGDGIDVDSCRDVRIEHCDIDTGDDAIAIKSGRGAEGARIGRPTENVYISDCKLGSRFAGLAIGSEMSGGVRNVRFERCQFTRGANAIFIKSRVGRGGFIEDITGRDLEAAVNGARTFLRIDLTSTGKTGDDPIPGFDGIPRARDFRFSDVRTSCPVLVEAVRISPERPLSGLSITRVTGTCQKGISMANVTNAELRAIDVSGFSSALVTIANVTGIGLEDATRIPSVADAGSATTRSAP